MLGKIREFLEIIPLLRNKDKVKIPYALIVEEPSFDNTALKQSKKKQEEHLILLHDKEVASDSSDTTIVEEFSGDLSTQNIPKSAPDKNKRGHVKLESDEERNKFFTLQNNPSANTINPKPFARGKNKYK